VPLEAEGGPSGGCRPDDRSPIVNLPRSVGDVLAEHVSLEVECVDRAYLNLYMPKLAYPLGVVGFFKHHRKMQFASGALMDPITKAFVAGIHRYVKDTAWTWSTS
jgi:hypothetical protein